MNNNEKREYLRREHGLDDDQITGILEYEWSGWIEDDLEIAEA